MPTVAAPTFVALESLTKSVPSISATVSSRCATPAKVRRPPNHGVAVDAHRESRGRGGHGVLQVVVADQAEL